MDCGPPVGAGPRRTGRGPAQLRRAAAPGAWLRGIGYHESVAVTPGLRDARRLVADRPLRMQHRSGALWMLNRAAVQAAGVRRRRAGGAAVPPRPLVAGAGAPVPLDLADVGRLLATMGVTGVTDATPDLDAGALDLLASASSDGELPQRLLLLGAPLDPTRPYGCSDRIAAGPWKLVLHEDGLDSAATADTVAAAHASGRGVAIHCVTRAEVVVAVDALERAGAIAGDRLEHASVLPAGFGPRLRELGVAVVTQPNFIAERGDAYARRRGG